MPIEAAAVAALLQGFLLMLARTAALVAFAPFPGWNGVSDQARAMLAVALALLLRPCWPTPATAIPRIGELLVLVLSEATIGLTIGLIIAALAESLLFAAQMASLQAGYSYASIIDPATNADSGLLPVLFQLVSGLLFFSFGVDRLEIAALAHSFDAFGPGAHKLTHESASAIIHLFGASIAAGLRLAMPVACLLMLADVALAVVGRVSAQLQLLSLAFPVKMLLSLAVLAACAPSIAFIYGVGVQRVAALLSAMQGHAGHV